LRNIFQEIEGKCKSHFPTMDDDLSRVFDLINGVGLSVGAI